MVTTDWTSRPTIPVRLMRLVGLVAVVLLLWGSRMWRHGPWLPAALLASEVAWLVWVVAPGRADPRIERAALMSMAILGGVSVGYVGGAGVIVYVAVFASVALLQHPIGFGVSAVVGGALAICLSASITHIDTSALLSALGGVVVVALMGLSRRQYRVAAEQNRLLLEQSRQIRTERDRAATLAERGRIARDVHDVLAHTLGGLVLQLEAADALLEAGETDQAASRVRSARELAGSGLDDARRVVGALRADHRDLRAELEQLIEVHRAAGAGASLRIDGEVHGLDEQVAEALARAAQECLTNARKHAPGRSVRLTLRVEPTAVTLEAANPTARAGIHAGGSLPGAGAGILGIRERIGALAGTVAAGKEGTEWIVRIRVPRK